MKAGSYLTRLALSAVFLFLSFNTAFAENKQIRLGATLPLTGDLATYGNLIRDGIELAVSELRKDELFDISVTYEDVPAPGPAAVTAINKLITVDHIQGLAGNFWNPVIPIMAPAIMREKIVTFHTAAADDLILGAGDYIFSTNSKIRDEASKIAEYVYNYIGSHSACVLYIGTTFGENYYKHFVARFEALGGKVPYSDQTKLGESDLKTVLAKVKNSECDSFFAAYFGNNLGLVLKQAKEVGLSKPTMAVYEAEDPSVLEVAGVAAEGLRFFVPEPVTDNPFVVEFKENFTKRFGYSPRILGSNAYDATYILVTALAECGGDRERAKDAIYKKKSFNGVSGAFSIDSDGGATKEFVLKTVKDGKFERVTSAGSK